MDLEGDAASVLMHFQFAVNDVYYSIFCMVKPLPVRVSDTSPSTTSAARPDSIKFQSTKAVFESAR